MAVRKWGTIGAYGAESDLYKRKCQNSALGCQNRCSGWLAYPSALSWIIAGVVAPDRGSGRA